MNKVHLPTGSLHLISTSDLYKVVTYFLHDARNKITHPHNRKEIIKLINIFDASAKSSSLLSQKIGNFLGFLIGDLLEFIPKQVEEIHSEAHQQWSFLVMHHADCYNYTDIQIRNLADSVPVLVISIIRALTGHSHSSISHQLYPHDDHQTKSHEKLGARIMHFLHHHHHHQKRAHPPEVRLNFNVCQRLSHTDVHTFFGYLFDIGSVVFGAKLGPFFALRYAVPIFHLIFELSEEHEVGDLKANRWERLLELVRKVVLFGHKYHGMRLYDSDPQPDKHAHEAELKSHLRLEIMEHLGKLVADVVSSTPEEVLEESVAAINLSRHAYRVKSSRISVASHPNMNRLFQENLTLVCEAGNGFDQFFRGLLAAEVPEADSEEQFLQDRMLTKDDLAQESRGFLFGTPSVTT